MFWLGAIASLCYIPGYTGAYIATQWPLFSLLLPLFLLRSGPVTAFHWCGVAFIVYAVLLAPFSPAPYASVFGLWQIVIMALFVWFGTVHDDLRPLYKGLAVGAAVSSLFGVLQFFGVESVPKWSTGSAGLYVNTVQQGTVLALLVTALVSERLWLWALPLLPGIAVCNSRGAVLALCIGLAACYVRRVWLLAVVAAFGLFVLLSPLGGSDVQRLFIWKVAYYNLSPVGWGPGVFYTILMQDPANGSSFFAEYAHNDALQLAFEYGFAALLPGAVLCFALSRTQARGWPVVVAFITAGCYSMPLFMPLASFVTLAIVGNILRDYGLARAVGGHRGQHVVSWRGQASGEAVPVASYHPARG